MRQLVNVILSSLIAVALSYLCSFAQSGQRTVVRQIGGQTQFEGEPASIGELGSIIVKDSSGLRVLMVAPKGQRPKAYQDVDLQQEDRILMVNGARVNSTEELTKAYEAIKVGDKIQLGVRRNGQLMVVAFDKADPASLPQRRMMVMKKDGKGDADFKINGKEIRVPEGIKNTELLPGIGLMIGTKDAKPVIAAVLPVHEENADLAALKAGDVITSVGGKPAGSVSDILAAYKSLKTGEKFVLKVSHEGTEREISVAKPDDSGIRMIEKK